MKKLIQITLISIFAFTANVNANETKPLVYINKSIGFNVEGYKYQQPALPCDVDKYLVEFLEKRGNKSGLNMEIVEGKEKVRNGTIPVLLIDIEQLVLRQSKAYGESNNFNLPKVQITAGILKGDNIQTAKHTCAMTSADKFTMPTDLILLNNPGIAICSEARKCLKDLSKDVIDWLKPQVE